MNTVCYENEGYVRLGQYLLTRRGGTVRGLPSVVPMEEKKIEEALTGGRYGEFGLRLGASCVGRFKLRLEKKVTRHERAGTALCRAVGVVLVLVAVDDEDANGDTSAAVEDPVLASLPSMVWGT
jgi:hypothetical protein